RRHGFGEDLFQRLGGLGRAIAGCSRTIDLCATIKVEAHGEFRTRDGPYARQRGERHRVAVTVADVEQAQILGARAVIALRLDIDLPGPSKAVEVVDKISAHERL